MSEFSRTPTGGANYRLFSKNSILVFVEGRDDRAFWKRIFPASHNEKQIKFKPVGGKPKLLEYVRKISFKKGQSIVAMDSDYDEILHDIPNCNFIIKTVRYSIENILFDPPIINKVADLSCHECKDGVAVGERWSKNITSALEPLLHLDLTSVRLKLGVRVYGNTCAECFARAGIKPDGRAVKAKCEKLQKLIDHNEVAVTRKMLSYRAALHLIRGSYLVYSVRIAIKQFAKVHNRSFSVSDEQLFDMFILALESVDEALVPHVAFLRRRAVQILDFVA